MESHLYCPITLEIMNDPYVASDGNTYEHMAIKKWLKTHKTSPLFGSPMDNKIIPNTTLKKIITTFLEYNPDKTQFQYKLPNKHKYWIKTINQIISNKDYPDLLNYTKFSLELLDLSNNELPLPIIKHIMKNTKIPSFELIVTSPKISKSNKKNMITLLLDENLIKISHKNPQNADLLYIATNYNEYEIVELLLDKGANINSINVTTRSTPLHMAVFKNNYEIVKLLVDRGANIHIKDIRGDEVIHLAVDHADCNIIQLLLDKGANPNSKNLKNITPLNKSITQRKTEAAKLLLKYGAEL